MGVSATQMALYEALALKLVEAGELEIDAQGRIWRVAARRWDRWQSRTRTCPCPRRRAEKPHAGGYLQVRVTVNGLTFHVPAHHLVFRYFGGVIPAGARVRHKSEDKTDNRPLNLEVVDSAKAAA